MENSQSSRNDAGEGKAPRKYRSRPQILAEEMAELRRKLGRIVIRIQKKASKIKEYQEDLNGLENRKQDYQEGLEERRAEARAIHEQSERILE